MNNINWKSLAPHGIAVLIFLVLSLAYFSPVLSGKKLKQHDTSQYLGMSKEISDFREKTGEEALWTDAMFGGMPAYQISVKYPTNIYSKIGSFVSLIPTGANFVFMTLVGFYFLLLVLGVNQRISIVGAIAFAFSSMNIIFILAGHNTKAIAIAWMAPTLIGIILSYRGKYLLGAVLAALGLGMQISANHLQITYYLAMMLGIYILFEALRAVKEKQLPGFVKASAGLVIAAIIAVGCNFTNLWTTYEYGKYSTRSQSELKEKSVSGGLDKDYALSWSYGKAETMTILIPNFMGGASGTELDQNSKMYEALSQKGMPEGQSRQIIANAPTYWGEQDFTSGPFYFGAFVVFLFVLGLVIVKGPLRWWILTTTALAILLSWGRHFQGLTDLFFDYFPGYNKFRAVTTLLVIAEFTFPLLGFLALNKYFEEKPDKTKLKKDLFMVTGIVGGIVLIFALVPGAFFDFKSSGDAKLTRAGYPEWLIEAVYEDRASLLRMDALRSLFFILAGAGLMWAVLMGKLKKELAIFGIGLLVTLDLWTVDKRYLDNDAFVSKGTAMQPYEATPADEMILQDKSLSYRVLNLTNPFNDAGTSYYHKSIGGYHGAKLKRYQELIEFQISKNNVAVLDMLNTKYFMIPGKDGSLTPQQNPGALGPVWFVKAVKSVANADEEMNALSNLNPRDTAVVDNRFADYMKGYVPGRDSLSTIALVAYAPNNLKYESSANAEQLAVFSEIFYDKGWNASIDGKPVDHIRVNYVLRALRVPAGKHTIEFKFEPKSYYTGNQIALASSSIFVIGCGLALFMSLRKKKEEA